MITFSFAEGAGAAGAARRGVAGGVKREESVGADGRGLAMGAACGAGATGASARGLTTVVTGGVTGGAGAARTAGGRDGSAGAARGCDGVSRGEARAVKGGRANGERFTIGWDGAKRG